MTFYEDLHYIKDNNKLQKIKFKLKEKL